MIKRGIIIVVLLLASVSLFGDIAGIYNSLLDMMAGSEEQNAGLTAFPVLLIPTANEFVTTMSAGAVEKNPAISVELPFATLSVSHRQWIGDSAVEAIALGVPFGPVGAAVVSKFFYTPFTSYNGSGIREASGYFLEYVVTAGAAIRLLTSPFFTASFGTNVKLVGRHITGGIESNQSVYSIPFDFGLLLNLATPIGKFALGTAFTNFGQKQDGLNAPLPTALTTGLSYKPVQTILISTDIGIPISLYPGEAPAESFSYNAGIEVRFAPFLFVSAGVGGQAENLSANIGSTIDFSSFTVAIDYTADIVTGFSPLDSLGISLVLFLGDAE